MISRRRASKYIQDIEQLQQNSFTAFKGIDVSKAPVSQDTLLDAENLDVDYDGGLILRKPLLYSMSTVSDVFKVHYAYEGTLLKQSATSLGIIISFIKLTDIYGNVYEEEWSNTWWSDIPIKDCIFVNTPSSTIITNVIINTAFLQNKFKSLYNKEILLTNAGKGWYTEQYVLLKLVKNASEQWVLEIMFPEMNVITSDTVAIDFNTALEHPLAIRDNYHAAQTAIRGILAYSPLWSLKQAVSLPMLTEFGNFKINSNDIDIYAYTVLKAFFDKPNVLEDSNLVIRWEVSDNGIDWKTIESAKLEKEEGEEDFPTMAEPIHVVTYDVVTNDLDSTKSMNWKVEDWHRLDPSSFEDVYENQVSIYTRPDCLIVSNTGLSSSKIFKCTLIKIKKSSESPYVNEEDFPTVEDDEGNKIKVEYIKDYELDSKTYFFNRTDTEILKQDFKNPITGNMIYYNHALYSISPEFKNNIYVSNPDSAIFPVSRIIDLGTYQSATISKLIPWRDYLVAFTNNSVYLIKEQEVGFTTKTVNTFIGVPERDANTCVSILNGIIFKSDNKLYSLIPNYNSGDESILNISDISKPIEHILNNLTYNESANPFAFTTSDSYYLFIPREVDTLCLKYNYSRKIWTKYTYPVVFYDFKIMDVSDIRLFTRKDNRIIEYYFEKEPSDISECQTYGDYITTSKDSNGDYEVAPIHFCVDSGQKTDNLSLTKQFVESKIVVATLNAKDSFKMDVDVAIEGNVFKKHVDLNTDGALLRNSPDQILTLGSNIESPNADTFNVIRQMFIRYSGKGKTVRHVISGESLYKFKIYETFYRYKLLNVKQ